MFLPVSHCACLALSTLFLQPAHAQTYPGGGAGGYPTGGWVPSDAAGQPLPSSDRGVTNDGSANLMPSGKQSALYNSYPLPDTADAWWFSVCTPNKFVATDPYYYYNGLHLSSEA